MEGDKEKSPAVCNICHERLADSGALRDHYLNIHGSDDWSQITFAEQSKESSHGLSRSAVYQSRLKPRAPSKQTSSLENMPLPGKEAAPSKKSRTETEASTYSKEEKAKGPPGSGKRSFKFKPAATSTPLSLAETDNMPASPVQSPSHEFDFWVGKPMPMYKKIWFATKIDDMINNVSMVSSIGLYETLFKRLYRDWLSAQVLSQDVRQTCNQHIETLLDLQRKSMLRGNFDLGQWIEFNRKDHFLPYEPDEMVELKFLNKTTARGILEAHKQLLELLRVLLRHAKDKGDINQKKWTYIEGKIGYQKAKVKSNTETLEAFWKKEPLTDSLILPPITEESAVQEQQIDPIAQDDSFEKLVAEGCLSPQDEADDEDQQICSIPQAAAKPEDQKICPIPPDDSFEALINQGLLTQEEERDAHIPAPDKAEQHRHLIVHTQDSGSSSDGDILPWPSFQPPE